MKPERVKIDISVAVILKIALVLGAIYLVYLLRDILTLIFVVLILVAALRPIVKGWGRKIGNTFAVIILLAIIITLIAGFIYAVLPPFVSQTKQLVENAPSYVQRFTVIRNNMPSLEKALSSAPQSFSTISGGFVSVTTGVFGGIVSFLTAIVLTIYLLLDEQFFNKTFSGLIPPEKRESVWEIIDKLTLKVGNWLRGQLVVGLLIGTLVFLGTTIIGLHYSLTLGVIAGTLEFIPIIGPIISGVLGTIVALFVSPITALITAVFYIILGQLNGSFMAPKIMQKAIGLPPAVIIVTILIGSKLLGVAGALLAVPISGIIFVILSDWQTIKNLAK